jgi:hypothetical protein
MMAAIAGKASGSTGRTRGHRPTLSPAVVLGICWLAMSTACTIRVESGGDPDGGRAGAEAGAGGLVCVFDIDSTLTCARSAEAVSACKNLGARLAINTAESRGTALTNKEGTGYIDWGELGFPTDGASLDMEHGAFVFGMCAQDGSCSEEFGGAPGDCERCSNCPDCPTPYMGKAYGMSRIARYYGVDEGKCLVLFDDLLSNTGTVELFGYSAHNHGSCAAGWDSSGVYEEVRALLKEARFASCF